MRHGRHSARAATPPPPVPDQAAPTGGPIPGTVLSSHICTACHACASPEMHWAESIILGGFQVLS